MPDPLSPENTPPSPSTDATPGVRVDVRPQLSPLLGRQLVHDERSRGFALEVEVEKSAWKDKSIRIYDPTPNPNQTVGNCTCCAKMMQFNAASNRVSGVVLDMSDAMLLYTKATGLDDFPGTYPPDDTGSSGLASAKAAQASQLGGEYRWLFGGADHVVGSVMAGEVVSVGTWWYQDMFNPDAKGVVKPGGPQVGGHQYIARGYNVERDQVLMRCWWGSFKDFWIARGDLDGLLNDGGDAHVQKRLTV